MARKNYSNKKNKQYNNSRNNKPRDRRESDETSCKASNDVSWYTKSPQLLSDAASFSFFNRLGDNLQVGTDGNVRLPGACRIGFVPTYGRSSNLSSAVNVAAMSMYSWVRHANSGSRNYESSDLMMYCMAIDSLYMYLAWMTRIYGTMSLYSQLNEYLPKAYLIAQDVDFDSLQGQMADFRYYINQFALKIGVFCVPKDLSMYTRHAWMCSNIYLDAPGAKSQAYIFQPDAFLKYSPKTSETGGELVLKPLKSTYTDLMTFEDIKTLGDELVAAVLADEDCGIISGDIRKAYGENLHTVAGISDGYVCVPTFDPEVLMQINNLTACGDVETYTFKQQNNTIMTQVVMSAKDSGTGFEGNRILNINYPRTTSPEDVMVATRLMCTGTSVLSGDGKSTINTPNKYGSEVVTTLTIIGTDGNQFTGIYPPMVSFIAPTTTGVSNLTWNLIDLGYFDWHPIIYRGKAPTMLGAGMWMFGDVQEYTVLKPSDIDKLHDAALLSMFNVPAYGSAIHYQA